MSKKNKLKKLGYKDYVDYLNSSHWQSIKVLFKQSKYATFKNGDRCCYACDTTLKIHIHHKTYERLGCERLSDLVYLCEDCHSITHKIARSGKIELENAHRYVNNYRKGIFSKLALSKKTKTKSKKQYKVFNLVNSNGKINYKSEKEKELIQKAIKANKCKINVRIEADFLKKPFF